MAKDKNSEEIDYDSDDSDMIGDEDIDWDDDFNWNDNGDNPHKDDRKPIEALKDGAKEGVKKSFTLDEVKDNVKMVLPKDIQYAKDEFSDYISRSKDIMNDAVTSVRSDVNRIRGAIAKAIPLAEKNIPSKRIVDLLKRLGKTEAAESRESEAQREENEIAEKLKDFTTFQIESQKQQIATDLIRTETERKRFESQQDILYAIEDGIKRGTSFHEQLTPKYYFKSLETGYRQLLVQTKIQNTLTEAMSHQRTALDTIVKNTALPDIVKQHKKELFKDLGLRSLYSAASNKLSDYTDNFKNAFFENLGNTVKGITSGISSSVEMGTGMADMLVQSAQMEEEFGGPKNRSHQAGEMIARNLTSFLMRQGMRKGIGKFDKNDKLGGLSLYLNRVAKGLPERLNKFAATDSDSSIMQLFKSLIPRSSDAEIRHDLNSIDKLNQPAQFDGMTRRSIVDIIPQLLSQIHLSTEGIRKSINPSQTLNQGDLLEYNHDTLELERRDSIDKAYLEKIRSQMSPDTLKRQAMQIVNAIDPWNEQNGFALDKEQRILLAKEIGLSLGKHKGFDPTDMVNDDYKWNTNIPPEDKLAIINHIRASFKVGEDTRTNTSIQKRLQTIDMTYRDMENTRGNIKSTIGKYSSINDTMLKMVTRTGLGSFSAGQFISNSGEQYNPMLFQGMGEEYTLDAMRDQYNRDNLVDITMEDFRKMDGYKVIKKNDWWDEHVIKNNESMKDPVFAKDSNGKRKEYVTFDEVRDAMARNAKYREKMNRIISNIRAGKDDTALQVYEYMKGKVNKYYNKAMDTKQGKYIQGKFDTAKSFAEKQTNVAGEFIKGTKAYRETTRVLDETVQSFSNHAVTKAVNEVLSNDELSYTDKIKAMGEISAATAQMAKDNLITTVESEEFKQKLDKVKETLQEFSAITGEKAQELYVKHTTQEQRDTINHGVSKTKQALDQIKDETSKRLTTAVNQTKEKLLEQEFIADLNDIATREDITVDEKAKLMMDLTKETASDVAKTIPEKSKVLNATFNNITKDFVNDIKKRSKPSLNVKSISRVDDSKFSLSDRPRARQTHRQQAANVLSSIKQSLKDGGDDPDPDGISRIINKGYVGYGKAKEYGNQATTKANDTIRKLYGDSKDGIDAIINKADGILNSTDEDSRFSFIKKFKEFTQRNTTPDEVIYDIYVKGDDEPRLMSSKLRKGHYVLKEDQRVVKHVSDITDTVIDITTGNVVITQEDITKGLIDYSGTEVGETSKSRSKFMRRLDKIQKITGDPLKVLGWLWDKTFAKTMDTTDIYLKNDLDKPILSRWGMMSGKYFNKNRKPVRKVKDIDGPVYDAYGNVLIDEDSLREGLVDNKGRPLRGYLIRRGRVAADMLKFMAKTAWKATKPARWLAGKALGTAASGVSGLLGTMLLDPTINRAKNIGSKGLNAISDGIGSLFNFNRKGSNKVQTIDGIVVDPRTGKERKGNYRDEMKAQDEQTKSRAEQTKARLEQMKKEREAKEGKGTGIFGLLGKYFPLFIGGLTGLTSLFSGANGFLSAIAGGITGLLKFIPNLIPGGKMITTVGKGLFTAGKAIFKGGKKLVTGAIDLAKGASNPKTAQMATRAVSDSALKQGAKQAAKTAGKTTLKQAAKLGGKVALKAVGKGALAVLGPIGAAIGAAWLLWDIGSWIYSIASSPDTVDKYRIAAYGINPENEDQAKAILKLEEYMAENASLNAEGVVKLPELKGDELTKFLHTLLGGPEGIERFATLPEEEQLAWQEEFQNWFNYRFCGVLQRNIAVLNSIDPKIKYNSAFGSVTGDLPNGLVNTWAQRTYYKEGDTDNPYGILFDPFSQLPPNEDDESVPNRMGQSEVKSYLDAVIDEYKQAETRLRNREKSRKNMSKARGEEYKSVFERIEETDNHASRENSMVENKTMSSSLDQANKTRVINKDGTSAVLTLEGNNAYIRSDVSAIKLDGRSVIDDLIAIRMRLYGLTDLVDTRVKALLDIEAAVSKYIRIDGNNIASIDKLDITKFIAVYAPALNWNITENVDVSAFRSWFQYRFAPIYLAYISELYKITQSKDFEYAAERLTPNDKYQIALAIISLQIPIDRNEMRIWDIDFTPMKGLYVNKDAGTIARNLETLQSGVEEKILTEKDPRGIKEVQKGDEKNSNTVGYHLASETNKYHKVTNGNVIDNALQMAKIASGDNTAADVTFSQTQGSTAATGDYASQSYSFDKFKADSGGVGGSKWEVKGDTIKMGSWSRTVKGSKLPGLNKYGPLITRIAQEAGEDPAIFLAKANIESGFDPKTGNANYGGLFAISKKDHPNWADPEYNTRVAVQLYKQNKQIWQKKFPGDPFTAGKSYLLHQQGAGGGIGLYANRMNGVSAAVALQNNGWKSKSLDWIKQKVIQSNGGSPDMSAGEFANFWINRADALYGFYSGASTGQLMNTAASTSSDTSNANTYNSSSSSINGYNTTGLNPMVQKAFFNQSSTPTTTMAGNPNGSGFGPRSSLYDGVATNKMPEDDTGLSNIYKGDVNSNYQEYDWGKSDPTKKLDWQNINPNDTNHSELTKNEVARSATPAYGPVMQHMGSENDKAATGLEGLLMQATPDLVNLGKQSLNIYPSKDLGKTPNPNEMNPAFMKLFYAMLGDYKKQKGGHGLFGTNQMHRSYQDQVIMKNKYGAGAAKPGNSKHGWGAAIDLNQDRASTEDLFKSGIAQKWGFTQPLKNWKTKPEWWHIENKYIGKAKGKKNGDFMGDVGIGGFSSNSGFGSSNDTVDGVATSSNTTPQTQDNGAMSYAVNNTAMANKPTAAYDIVSVSNTSPVNSFAPSGVTDIQPTVQNAMYTTAMVNDASAQPAASTNMGLPTTPAPQEDNQTKLIEAQQQRIIDGHQKMVDSVNAILSEQLNVQKETRDIMSQLVSLLSDPKALQSGKPSTTQPSNNAKPATPPKPGNVPRGMLNVSVV